MSVTSRTFNVSCYLGLDRFLSLLPVEWQARAVAKKLLRGPFEVPQTELSRVNYIFALPNGSCWRIRNPQGDVEAWTQ